MTPQLFIFSEDYKILKTNELKAFEALDLQEIGGQKEWEKVHNGEAFVLCSKNYKYQFIINPVIKYFLEQFQERPTTFQAVLSNIAMTVNSTESVVQPIVEPFFRTMVEQNMLQFYEDSETTENENAKTENYLFDIGETIENYTIEQLITQKKFVEIYLAKSLKTKQHVVIKVMRYDQIFPPKLQHEIAFFKQEFDMMRQLSHLNVCAFVDYYSDENLTFGVMEYIAGENTRKHLKTQNLSLNQRLHIFKQMVAAVAHLHEKGLTHGDLHASNFMISEDNQVKLIDFGFTHHVEALEHELEIEGGTMAYLPPECVNPNSFDVTSKRVDFRGEVYQLGVIAYILLYEVRPFRGLTWQQLCENIKSKNPSFPSSTPKGEIIPDFILNLVQTAMNKKPNLRFANAMEILVNW